MAAILTLPGLFEQLADAAVRVPCSQVWGGSCAEPVGSPNWSHDNHPQADQRDWAARQPGSPPELLRMLSYDPADQVRWKVAGNPAAPVETVSRLCRDPQWTVRKQAVLNPGCPEDILERASHDEAWEVRNSVARNPHSPPGCLRRLAQDSVTAVRATVAAHPQTPPDVLRVLAQRQERRLDNIYQAVAGNPACPSDLLQLLACSDNPMIRLQVARNINTPAATRIMLTRDKHPGVALAATYNPAQPGEPADSYIDLTSYQRTDTAWQERSWTDRD